MGPPPETFSDVPDLATRTQAGADDDREITQHRIKAEVTMRMYPGGGAVCKPKRTHPGVGGLGGTSGRPRQKIKAAYRFGSPI